MKVLFINTSDMRGGAARAAVRLIHGVQQMEIEAEMFVKYKQSQYKFVVPLRQFIPQTFCYNLIDWIANKIKNKWQQLQWRPYRKTKENVFMSDARGTRLGGALHKLDYDILHIHWINQRFVKLQDLPKDKPIIWTLHDSWSFCGICHYFLDCLHYQSHCGNCPLLHSSKEKDLSYRVFEEKKFVYKNLNLHIVTPSRWLGECARKSTLLCKFPISVIPNCIDTDVFRPLSKLDIENKLLCGIKDCVVRFNVEQLFAITDIPIILYGAVNAATDKIKGFVCLLDALYDLDKQGFEANLVVFGASESDLPMKFEHIKVSFVGYVSDTDMLVALYNLANVMVVPSLTENLSCAIMESLSCGTPVCCFDIGGNSDMVEHQVNGYLAREKDSVDLANGIWWCIENNKNGTLSMEARKKVLRDYTIERVGQQYVELYKSIMYK